jgi:hypothetical protein
LSARDARCFPRANWIRNGSFPICTPANLRQATATPKGPCKDLAVPPDVIEDVVFEKEDNMRNLFANFAETEPRRASDDVAGQTIITKAPGAPHFRKAFRWQQSDVDAPKPATVELVGSLTNWEPLSLEWEAATNTWQVALGGISGNRTHRYMLLVDHEPTCDKNCDGLTVPESIEETQYALMTARGPRILLLFSQTK